VDVGLVTDFERLEHRDRDHAERLRQEHIAAPALRQRIARHWEWWWDVYAYAAVFVALAGAALIAYAR
jgi:hypothetical protein